MGECFRFLLLSQDGEEFVEAKWRRRRYIIPSNGQRPWSPPIGYQCVYESYFGDHTKLWFPIPRLITSYAFRRDIAICQLLNGSLRIAVMLMVMAAEIDVSMSVRVFEELTFRKAEPHGIFSVKMRSS